MKPKLIFLDVLEEVNPRLSRLCVLCDDKAVAYLVAGEDLDPLGLCQPCLSDHLDDLALNLEEVKDELIEKIEGLQVKIRSIDNLTTFIQAPKTLGDVVEVITQAP